jgi:signal transduction histidine kinase
MELWYNGEQIPCAPMALIDRRQVAFVGWLGVLALGYYLAVRLGLGFRFQNSIIGVVWIANGVLLAALLLTKPAHWPFVFGVTALAHAAAMLPDAPAWRVLWQLGINAGLTITLALVLRRFAGLPLTLGTRRQVLTFTTAAFCLPALFSLGTPVVVRAMLGLEPDYAHLVAWVRVTLSNATATLLITPVIVLWGQRGWRPLPRLNPQSLWEGVAILVFLITVGIVVFSAGPEVARFPALLLLIFAPLLWTAVRLGPLGASTALLGMAALSALGTAVQVGPFVLFPDATKVLSLQLFWITMSAPIMLLAAVIREREFAEATLLSLRQHLTHATRVATAGELSGALAHELRQPLTSILANAEAARALLDRGGADPGELRSILADIAEQDRYASNVITRLRAFVQGREPHYEPLALDEVARDALALTRIPVDRLGVVVETEIDNDLPRVWGDPVQILQVILNLILNACESMGHLPPPERHLRLRIARNDTHYVELAVEDRGDGLPLGAEERVFEPFFTTKETGLGLGLAIGRSIVTAHGGRLLAQNNEGRGATFRVLLRTI